MGRGVWAEIDVVDDAPPRGPALHDPDGLLRAENIR
jgi:hypothetical protein